jgi:Na+-transporting methylmalonyl-CoA/oxaloacetate decarboxylase beta subunit
MARVARTRTFVGLTGFAPLLVSFACAGLVDLGPLCAIPREVYLGVWAAIFGTFLGLTIRMWRERRAFEKASAAT